MMNLINNIIEFFREFGMCVKINNCSLKKDYDDWLEYYDQNEIVL